MFYIFYFILWIYGFLGVLQGQMKLIPLLGEQFQKIFKNTKIVKGFLMALLDLKEYEIKKIEITDPFTLGENDEEKEGILDIKLILNQCILMNQYQIPK